MAGYHGSRDHSATAPASSSSAVEAAPAEPRTPEDMGVRELRRREEEEEWEKAQRLRRSAIDEEERARATAADGDQQRKGAEVLSSPPDVAVNGETSAVASGSGSFLTCVAAAGEAPVVASQPCRDADAPGRTTPAAGNVATPMLRPPNATRGGRGRDEPSPQPVASVAKVKASRASVRSVDECGTWLKRVHEVQSKRTPEAWEAAKRRIEQARAHEVSFRKCKAVKGHAVRSRALAVEGLRQMSEYSAPADLAAAQARWKSAQVASSTRQEMSLSKYDDALRGSSRKKCAVEVLADPDSEEESAMQEVAAMVGAADVSSMSAVGEEGLRGDAGALGRRTAPGKGGGGRGNGVANGGGGGTVEAMLEQLRKEPTKEAECAAKFALYEGYGAEVEKMRGTLLEFYEESQPQIPPAVASDMDAQIKDVDSHEGMSIPDRAREWFVFHMMRQAERNNLKMARILDGFEKKLEFLASNDQAECPVCLEPFENADGAHTPETLGCCHKVCKDCWESWTSVMGGRPFCPLCRHVDFMGAVTAHVSGAPLPMFAEGSDDD